MSLKWLPHWGRPNGQAPNEPPTKTAEPNTSVSSGDESQDGGELTMPVSADVILEALKEVEDPELGISIVELGLIYGIEVEGKKVRVRMTLTSPGCPIGPMLQTAVHGTVTRVYPQAEDVRVDLVWNPPWDPYKMASEEAKDMLGIW